MQAVLKKYEEAEMKKLEETLALEEETIRNAVTLMDQKVNELLSFNERGVRFEYKKLDLAGCVGDSNRWL